MRNIAIISVLVLALGVSACGRKGPLAPPPGSASVGPVMSDVRAG